VTSVRRQTWIVEQLDVRPADDVLEVGCGHGVAAGPVLDRLTTGRYVGLDRSSSMVAAAERRNRDAIESGRARFVCDALPGADLGGARFDRMFAVRTPAVATADGLAFATRHLAPGGVLLLAFDDPSPDRSRMHVRTATERLGPAGFGPATVVSQEIAGQEVVCVIASPAPG
jgi:SAM-dependent methyltransferase